MLLEEKIEFSGYLTGKAEKFYWKKATVFGACILWGGAVLMLPVIAAASRALGDWRFTVIFGLAILGLPLLGFLPKRKKAKFPLTPKRIHTDGEYIVSIGDKFTESKLISDARRVVDHGEFYELVFPFGNYSDKFICQKSLLREGTLEAFEALFEGKLIRKALK